MPLSLDGFYSTLGASSSARTLVDTEAPLSTSPTFKAPTNSSPVPNSPISPPGSSPIGESETSLSEDDPFVVYDPRSWLPPEDFVYSRRPTRHDRSRGGVTRTPNAFLLFRACKVVGRCVERTQQQDVSRVASGMWRAMPKFVQDAWKATARRIKREREMNVQAAVLNEVHVRARSLGKKDGRKAGKSSLRGSATTPSSPVKPRSRRLSLPPPSRVSSPPRPQPLQSLPPLPALILEKATASSAHSMNSLVDQPGNSIQTIDPRSISISHTVHDQPPPVPPSSRSQGSTAAPFVHEPTIHQNPVEKRYSHYAPLHTTPPSSSVAQAPLTPESSLPIVLKSFERILQVPGCDDLHGQANMLMLMYIQRLAGSAVL